MAFWASAALTVAGLAAGKAKNDKAQQIEDAQRKQAQATEKYSWITGQHAQPIERAGSLFGDELQGGLSGFSMGQGIQSAANANKLNDAMVKNLNYASMNAAEPGNVWLDRLNGVQNGGRGTTAVPTLNGDYYNINRS